MKFFNQSEKIKKYINTSLVEDLLSDIEPNSVKNKSIVDKKISFFNNDEKSYIINNNSSIKYELC